MKIEELLAMLNLELSTEKGNKVICNLKDSNHFSKIYSLLDNRDEFELLDDRILINENLSQFMFESDNFSIKLIGNFDDDTYKLIIEEK